MGKPSIPHPIVFRLVAVLVLAGLMQAELDSRAVADDSAKTRPSDQSAVSVDAVSVDAVSVDDGQADGSGEIVSTSPPIARSLAQLRRLQQSDDSKDILFDLLMSLVFASSSREHVFLQSGDMPLSVKAADSVRSMLAVQPPGCLVRVKGIMRAGTWTGVSTDIQVADPNYRIRSKPARIAPGTLGTPTKRLGELEGSAIEVYTNFVRNQFYVHTHEGDCEAWVFDRMDADAAHAIVGSPAVFQGAVMLHGIGDPTRTLHYLLSMNRCQIVLDQPDPSTDSLGRAVPRDHAGETDLSLDGPAESIEYPSKGDRPDVPRARQRQKPAQLVGTVVFSDGLKRIAVVSGSTRYLVRTRFANELETGMKVTVRGVTCWNHSHDLTVIQSESIESLGRSPLPQSQSVTVGVLMTSGHLPPRVSLTGVIQSTSFRDQTCLIRILSDGQVFEAEVSGRAGIATSDLCHLVPDAVVSVSGMPIRWEDKTRGRDDSPKTTQRKRSVTRLSVKVGSADDLAIVSYPVQVSPRIAMWTLVGALATAALVVLWIVSLRRQVRLRTARLTSIAMHMKTALEAMQGAVLIVDDQEVVCRANHQFEDLFGFRPRRGKPLAPYIDAIKNRFDDPDAFDRLGDNDAGPRNASRKIELQMNAPERIVHGYTNLIRTPDGQCHGRLWMFEDVTETRRLEAELAQAQKMEAVGHLSGGIAHDFNNFLSVIRSSLTLIHQSQPVVGRVEDPAQEYLGVANQAVDRAAALTAQLLDFARRSRLELKRVDANSVVRDACRLLRGSLDRKIRLTVIGSDQDTRIHADVNRIEQVIINLCLNARDAIEPNAGNIELAVANVHDAQIGAAVRIRVSDDGVGMSPDIVQQIFEPFYTTKDVGDGTGLGLSVAHGVVQQHGGVLRCESLPGVGTTFEILLPECDQEFPADGLTGSTQHGVAGGHEDITTVVQFKPYRILLVDDEPLVRQSASAVLERLSHDVVLAENGMQALATLASDRDLDIVLLDLTMPEMSGLETFYEIRSAWPDQKIIFYSGYSSEYPDLEHLPPDQRPPLIGKPFKLAELQRTMVQWVGRSPRPEPSIGGVTRDQPLHVGRGLTVSGELSAAITQADSASV